MWAGQDNSRLIRFLWWLNVSSAIEHGVMLISILSTILNAPAYDTYQLIVPLNETAYVSDSTPFSAQGALIAVHLMTMIAHIVYLVLFDRYVAYTENTGRTPYRWLEYAISAPLMIIIIAVVCGVRDRAALISMAGLVFGTILCGAIMQMAPASAMPVCGLAFTLLTLAFAQIWVAYGQWYDKAPNFVGAIVATMSILFYSFGFVPLYAHVYNKSVLFEECVFCVLSSTSKGLLSGLVIPSIDATAM